MGLTNRRFTGLEREKGTTTTASVAEWMAAVGKDLLYGIIGQ